MSARKKAFLAALADGHSVREASRRSGLDWGVAYRHRKRDAEFDRAWVEAYESGTQVLEEEAFRRAVHGVERPVFSGGKQVGTVTHYSDRLLILMLKARRPSVYREQKPAKTEDRTVSSYDLSRLSDSELETLESLLAKAERAAA